MKQRKLLILLVLVLLGGSRAVLGEIDPTPIGSQGGAAPARTVHLVILHDNDIHGHLEPFVDKQMDPVPGEMVGGAAALATAIAQQRKAHPGALLLDAGDIAQGTPVSNMFYGMSVVEVMNHIGYDAEVLGNHEFDWGQKRTLEMIHAAHTPVLAANVVRHSNGKFLEGVRPYIIKKVNGVKVGILGLLTPATVYITFPANVNGLDFLAPDETARKYLPQMRKEGAQFIVLLTHLGVEEDKKLAAAVPGINVIVGGHSHTPLIDPVEVNHTVIVQAGSYSRYLGVLEVDFDPVSHAVVDYTRKNELEPIIDKQFEPDPEVAAIVKKYEDQVGPLMSQVIGQAAEDLPNSNVELDTPLGDTIADSLRREGKTDVGFYNAGGVRAPMYRGPIKMGDIYTTLPFDNVIVTFDMKGTDVLEVLKQSIINKKGMIDVSGMTFAYSPADGSVHDVMIAGNPVDPSKTYKVATIDFLFSAGDNFTAFSRGTHPVFGRLARDVFVDYVRAETPLTAPAPGRISFAKEAPTR